MKKLIDPSLHPDWLKPHSLEWYQQLASLHGKYLYPWNSILEKPNGESIFDNEVLRMVHDKKVLDIGCGHGDFAIECSETAKEIVGFDITQQFVEAGNRNKKENVSFVVGDLKDGLPFEMDQFDCAYIRKGPTSAYPLVNRVVKKGCTILGLHPGDESGVELLQWFPNLFQKSTIQIIDVLNDRLKNSNFAKAEIESINSIEFLQSPIDVIKLCCFGQKETVYEMVEGKNMDQILKIFEANASHKGLPITFSRYIIRIKV
ncbi:class I SAM-dependent methyltransferase [Paucisalibacillus globulus]|uniref:class I SAM-dependent methyltransferase n=1 Tax=Paucisalibacillus globulus TaxID=351095 RepID=UPI0003F98802|nr:class I SAM-dependent methyltransferase [Paucisalibacillus globulus]